MLLKTRFNNKSIVFKMEIVHRFFYHNNYPIKIKLINKTLLKVKKHELLSIQK